MDDKMSHNQRVGERLKELKKENGSKRALIEEITGYSGGHISDICSGKRKLTDEAAGKLAKEWNVRKDYILCKDDFKTDEDLFKYMNECDIGDMRAAMGYLETLGLTLIPRNYLRAPVASVYERYPEIKDCIKEEDREQLLNKYDFSLPASEFKKKYALKVCYLQLIAPLPEDMLLSEEGFSKESPGSRYIELGEDGQTDSIVSVYFEAYLEGKCVQRLGVKKVQSFVETLDLYTRFSIDHLLLNGDEGDIF